MQAPYTGFERVFRRELPFVWAAARRFGVHPAALDDAVQDVFLTAYRRWDDLHYEDESSPRAWLYGVTRRVAFRYRRSEARTLRRKAAVAHGSAARSTSPHAERDGAHDVDAVLAGLEPAQREVFVMAELLDMSGPEIAAQLKIPVNTVYSRLRLARRQLERTVARGGMRAWVHQVRRTDEPPRGQAQRSWALLVPMLPGPGATGVLATIGAAMTGKLLVGLGAAVLVGAVVIGGWIGRDREAGGAPAVSAREAAQRPTPARSSEAVDEGASEPAGLAAEGSASSAEPEQLEPEPGASATPRGTARTVTPSSRSSSSEAVVTPSSRSSSEAAVAPSSAETSSSTLEAEVAVLDRATAALRSDDAPRALQWLTEHEQRFPEGHLVDVRKATRVRVLCRLGRDAQARAEAAALRREHPGSAVARRVPDSCAEA